MIFFEKLHVYFIASASRAFRCNLFVNATAVHTCHPEPVEGLSLNLVGFKNLRGLLITNATKSISATIPFSLQKMVLRSMKKRFVSLSCWKNQIPNHELSHQTYLT